MSDLTLDFRPLEAALLYVESTTGRDCATSLNKAGGTVIVGSSSGQGAMQLTPKAAAAKINAVTDKQLAAFVATRARKSGKRLTPDEFRRAVKKERSRRKSAAGYHAYAGWHNAAVAMGKRGLRRPSPAFPRSEAVRGKGQKAVKGHLTVVLTNTAPAIERIGKGALQTALNNAAKDLMVYADNKLAQRFKEVQP